METEPISPLVPVEGTPALLQLNRRPLEPMPEPTTLRGRVAALIDPAGWLAHPGVDPRVIRVRRREALRTADMVLALVEASIMAEMDRAKPDHATRAELDAIAEAFQAKVNEA